MKKVLRSLSVLVIAGILLVSCNKNSSKFVAITWLNNFYHADYEAAIPYSTDLTKKQLDQFSNLASYVTDSNKKELKKLVVTVKDVKEKGDTAIATYTVSDNPRDQNITLVKINGKWLVLFTKNDSFNSADYVPEQPTGPDSTSINITPVDTNATEPAKNKD